MKDQSLLNSLMIKVRICSEHKYDIILGKGKVPLKSAYKLANLPYIAIYWVYVLYIYIYILYTYRMCIFIYYYFFFFKFIYMLKPSLQQVGSAPERREGSAPGGAAPGAAPGTGEQKDKKRKESILDLSKYLDKAIRVKFSGGREASGILKGFDQLLNLVLDNTIEYLRG